MCLDENTRPWNSLVVSNAARWAACHAINFRATIHSSTQRRIPITWQIRRDRIAVTATCQLDKTLKWTANHLKEWYSIDEPELDAEQSEIAASILWLLKGDALGSDSERSNAIQSIIARWDQDSHAANPALLLGPENVVKTKRIDAIMKHRDDTPMQLAEYQCSWPSKRSRWSAGPRPDSV